MASRLTISQISRHLGSMMVCSSMVAPFKWLRLRSAFVKFAPQRLAPVRSAPVRLAPLRSASRRLARFRLARPRLTWPSKAPRRVA